ncbi:hypothetical protein GJAV_G00213730 [Gymnothorax javanicus]|nr:hypothetical protein GJAV_G00213730 [Gymnothorax javanicus]
MIRLTDGEQHTDSVSLSLIMSMLLCDEFALVLVSLTLLLSVNMTAGKRMSKIPMRGGCLRLSSEVAEFRLQGEAVVLQCGFLESFLQRQGFSQDEGSMRFLRVGGSGSEDSIPAEERVKVEEQRRRLWFLPAVAADSGTYSCVFRNASYCCASTIRLQVYEAREPHLDAVSYPMLAYHGQNMKLSCHHIDEFNISGNLKWYKEATPIAISMNRTRYRRDTNTSLTIQNVGPADSGFYTCKLHILFNNTGYTVTRIIKLSVEAPEPEETSATPSPSSGILEKPKIIDPANGTLFQSTFGSSLLVICTVSSGSQSADSTEVTWLINGQPVQEYFLSGRVLLGEKTVTVRNGVHYIELGLIFLELVREDTRAEIKCVAQNHRGREEAWVQIRLEDSTLAWFTVAAVGTVCFLMVVCAIFYQLLKSKPKADYILARQNSTF